MLSCNTLYISASQININNLLNLKNIVQLLSSIAKEFHILTDKQWRCLTYWSYYTLQDVPLQYSSDTVLEQKHFFLLCEGHFYCNLPCSV